MNMAYTEKGIRYRHYKGNEYTVVAIARLESNPTEEQVVYQSEYDSPDFGMSAVWIRPRSSFEEIIEIEGKRVHRFKRI